MLAGARGCLPPEVACGLRHTQVLVNELVEAKQ
jgi:hypothetical protein